MVEKNEDTGDFELVGITRGLVLGDKVSVEYRMHTVASTQTTNLIETVEITLDNKINIKDRPVRSFLVSENQTKPPP